MPSSTSSDLNQDSYEPSPYEDQDWNVIGEPPGPEEFLPMQVSILPSTSSKTDQMFANFGGIAAQETDARWHLPEHLAFQTESDRKAKEEAELSRQSFTDDELKQLLQAEYAKGLQEGKMTAFEGENAKLAALENRIIDIVKDLSAQMKERVGHLEKKAVELGVEISHKIIEGAVEVNPEYVIPIVRQALDLAGGANVKKVKVSPQDMEFIQVVGVAKQLKEYDGTWIFEADETVKAGCIVETSAGEIDFKIDEAWNRVKESVLKVLR